MVISAHVGFVFKLSQSFQEDQFHPGVDRNIAKVAVAKHRNGPTRDINVIFHKELTQFFDALPAE